MSAHSRAEALNRETRLSVTSRAGPMHGNKEACERDRRFHGKPCVPAVRRVLKEEFAIKVTRRGNVVVEEHLGREERM